MATVKFAPPAEKYLKKLKDKADGSFNVYDDIRNKLIARGVPESEIAFIHNADTEAKKKDLFSKVRSGQVRILLGSTQKIAEVSYEDQIYDD